MRLVSKSIAEPEPLVRASMGVGRILGAAGIAIVFVVGLVALWVEIRDRQPPNLAVMRQYRISKLTDDQIREMHAVAESEFAKVQQEAVADGETFWRRYSEECAKTQDDVAYRVRHPDECRLPITWQSIGKPLERRTVEQIFEGKILGICNLVFTVRDAKRYDCLPP